MCQSSETLQPQAKGGEKSKGSAKVRMLSNLPGVVVRASQCRKKKVHALKESTSASEVGSQDTIMVGSVESYFDVASVSEVILEPRGEGEKICSMDAPNVREDESFDIEINSGAEVSDLPVNISADTYPLHEMRLSMCGGHHVATGGGRLHELCARTLGMEATNVRGDDVNLLVRFRVM